MRFSSFGNLWAVGDQHQRSLPFVVQFYQQLENAGTVARVQVAALPVGSSAKMIFG
ncbi:MAG: hypothetical protein U0X20_05225 [Caldilineaceae bacterium]